MAHPIQAQMEAQMGWPSKGTGPTQYPSASACAYSSKPIQYFEPCLGLAIFMSIVPRLG